ncbi:hypothetical protein GYMLUDRAFT_242154 [Collybiopsis luxurians FD-317 M1]|uniref:Unplaced genomic scaffold GYMLUscaffold_17, whole genome shotgun sequence n=1 Tax=Collybiopsis luxurians FD-317 M1 TaxID=944289 RepID=A0A0D0BGQ4_9AGAR|nr:hypothetical protein GYMLUDRAFT_242154 [Collybiopsis luxurians FD-317 M1]
MKLSALLILAGAGLLQVNASPLRLVVVGPEGGLNPQSGSNSESVAHIQSIKLNTVEPKFQQGSHRGCAGARFRQKAVEMSNSLRQALGMPLIQTEFVYSHSHDGKGAHVGEVHILPFHGTPSELEKLHKPYVGDGKMIHVPEVPSHHHKHHKHHSGHFPRSGSFMKRVHFALMTLGPWEGRAVAFVLGCGLGVLLRMFWALTVVSYRAIRGEDNEEETHYVPVPNQHDAEEIFVAPPVYIIDEKAPLREEMKAAEETN